LGWVLTTLLLGLIRLLLRCRYHLIHDVLNGGCTDPFPLSVRTEDERRSGSTVVQSFKRAPMVTGSGGGDYGREKLGWGSGKVEEVLGKMLAQGIEVWWPEEGDRRKMATAERADERSSSLIDVGRRKEEMTTGPTTR